MIFKTIIFVLYAVIILLVYINGGCGQVPYTADLYQWSRYNGTVQPAQDPSRLFAQLDDLEDMMNMRKQPSIDKLLQIWIHATANSFKDSKKLKKSKAKIKDKKTNKNAEANLHDENDLKSKSMKDNESKGKMKLPKIGSKAMSKAKLQAKLKTLAHVKSKNKFNTKSDFENKVKIKGESKTKMKLKNRNTAKRKQQNQTSKSSDTQDLKPLSRVNQHVNDKRLVKVVSCGPKAAAKDPIEDCLNLIRKIKSHAVGAIQNANDFEMEILALHDAETNQANHVRFSRMHGECPQSHLMTRTTALRSNTKNYDCGDAPSAAAYLRPNNNRMIKKKSQKRKQKPERLEQNES